MVWSETEVVQLLGFNVNLFLFLRINYLKKDKQVVAQDLRHVQGWSDKPTPGFYC